jgi:prenylcysteine oxidase/farnesylcysteine lyase
VPDDLGNVSPTSGEAITWYYPHVFHSYPIESPRVTFEEIELARGFYYTSGIESFISSMETSALMGMNVAQLIVNDYLELLVDNKVVEDHLQLQQAVLQQEL